MHELIFLAFTWGYQSLQKKISKSDLLPWIEKLGDKLPGWKASLMYLAGRVTWVRFVLTAIPIYAMIAVSMPKWFIKAVNKLHWAFTWKGRDKLNGGSCLVAWEKVQRPLDLGGLGILNLEYMGWSLQMRWLWYMKTTTNRPWKGLDTKIHPNVVALFNIALTTYFWTDRWFMGCCIGDLAPEVVAAVPPMVRDSRSVQEVLIDRSWPRDVKGVSRWSDGMITFTFGMLCMIWL